MGKVLIALVLVLGFVSASAEEFKINTKEILKRELKSRTMSLLEWTAQINTEGFDLLCLGETHNKYFRTFYAEKILSQIKIKTLALEGVQDEVGRIRSNYVESIEDRINISGVAINQVSDVVLSLNPEVQILGIESTQEEVNIARLAELKYLTKEKVDTIVSRDGFIAEHVDKLFENGQNRIVALYGRKHCAKYSTKNFGFNIPFYRLLLDKYEADKKLLSVHVISRFSTNDFNVTPLLRAYADEFDLLSEDVVLVNPGEIAPKDYNYSQELMNMFQNYDVVILEGK